MTVFRRPATVPLARDGNQPVTEDTPPAENLGAVENDPAAALAKPATDESPTTGETPIAADKPAPLVTSIADETPTGAETPTTGETPIAADKPAPLVTSTAEEAPTADEPTADQEPTADDAQRWRDLLVSFVDGPRDAVDAAQALVSSELDRVVRLVEDLEDEGARLRAGCSDDASTEDLRVTLRGLRALSQRLHALPS